MLNDRQALAWRELELGPLWIARREDHGAGEAQAAEVETIATGGAADDSSLAEPPPEIGAATSADSLVQGERDARAADSAPALDDWQKIREEVSGCQRCGLSASRRRTVFGSGSERARWMLVGEAPGAEEDARGEPFVGQAGRLLDQMLASIGLSRSDDVFITNVLKCRPPGNRNPEPLEADTCSGYLHRQIELLQPDLILLLGRFAVQSVLKTDASLAGLRGRVHAYRAAQGDIPVVCTYHPAYLLRNLPDKRKSWEDLCLAMDVAASRLAARAGAGAGDGDGDGG